MRAAPEPNKQAFLRSDPWGPSLKTRMCREDFNKCKISSNILLLRVTLQPETDTVGHALATVIREKFSADTTNLFRSKMHLKIWFPVILAHSLETKKQTHKKSVSA